VGATGTGPYAGAETANWSFRAVVPLHPITKVFAPPYLTYRFPELEGSSVSPGPSEAQDLFRAVFTRSDEFLCAPSLALEPERDGRLQRYLLGYRGDAAAFSGHLGRMIYLSAVVITTLGLGDILPLTSLARLLVAFEAVSGIVLAGLVLNAVAYRAAKGP
jgi:hypothetical protein